jgi:hypothetical protein
MAKAMNYLVYYYDDYAEMGGVGLETFDTTDAALRFIEDRLRVSTGRTLSNYTLIKGQVLPIEMLTTAVKVGIKAY